MVWGVSELGKVVKVGRLGQGYSGEGGPPLLPFTATGIRKILRAGGITRSDRETPSHRRRWSPPKVKKEAAIGDAGLLDRPARRTPGGREKTL